MTKVAVDILNKKYGKMNFSSFLPKARQNNTTQQNQPDNNKQQNKQTQKTTYVDRIQKRENTQMQTQKLPSLPSLGHDKNSNNVSRTPQTQKTTHVDRVQNQQKRHGAFCGCCY